jgi:hypothetical protein
MAMHDFDGLYEVGKYVEETRTKVNRQLSRTIPSRIPKVRVRDLVDKDTPFTVTFYKQPPRITIILNLEFDTAPLLSGDPNVVLPGGGPPPGSTVGGGGGGGGSSTGSGPAPNPGTSTWTSLARIAGDIIVGGSASNSLVVGILAQWFCEVGRGWTPTRNNPGNLAEGWASAFPQFPYTVRFPNPQPGNPIVSYFSAVNGAKAYATGLRTFSRYGTAVSYARAGNGLAFSLAVCDAGYGTSRSCVTSVWNTF